MKNEKLLMDYNDKPETGKWFALSFQHVFAMFSATVLVPLLTGLPVSIALFSSGLGTLIYILCTKGKVPMYLGSSFAYLTYIGTVLTAVDGGRGALILAILAVGLIYTIVSFVIKACGTKWLTKILPPVVVGPMIIIIGLCLAGTAVSQTGLVAGGSWKAIVVSLSTLVITACLAIKGKGFFKIIPFLLGIVGGYIVALALNWLPGDRLFDFTGLVNVLKTPKLWFAFPEFTFLGFENKEIFLGMHTVKANFNYVVPVIPIAFATICEHIGDHQVLGKITGKNYTEEPGLDRTLLGDGLATLVAGLMGSVPNTSYGENTAVVGMTKIGSVWVTGLAAVIAVCLSFFNVFTQLISTIPTPVMGGICLVLYGFIASNGLKVLFDNKIDMTSSRNLIIISVMLIIGLGGATLLGFGGMALASIFGILLNAFLPKEETTQE